MTEKQGQWRPPVAPKSTQAVQSVTRDRNDAALRGATRAFIPSNTHSTQHPRAAPASGAALAAASATANSRITHAQTIKKLSSRNEDGSPERGRTPNMRIPVLNATTSAWGSPITESLAVPAARKYASCSPSAIAARLASAAPSPSRVQEEGINAASKLPSSVLTEDNLVKHASQKFEALSGASASLSAARKASGGHVDERHQVQLDFGKIPVLSRQSSSHPPQPSPSPGGIAAAAAAMTTAASSLLEQADNVNSLLEDDNHSQYESPDLLSRYTTAETSAGLSNTTPSASPRIALEADGYFPAQAVSLTRPMDLPQGLDRVARRPPIKKSAIAHSYSVKDMRVYDLADAIVASSLASSTRPVSPAKGDEIRKRSLSLGVPRVRRLLSEAKSPTLAPQLPRAMKHTLRKERDGLEYEDEQKRGKRHWVRKHPNVHHEGDRKRWRDTVNARERKRYEGLWAANRGIHVEWLPPSADSSGAEESEMVTNIVVRDIWERSHLARDVLEEIWDLVSPQENVKSLGREEFVLGLFLIDQRLKGRKLPTKLSASLLGSVRHTHGVRISNKSIGRYFDVQK